MKEFINVTMKKLKENNIDAYYVDSISDLHKKIKELLNVGETIGSGDSVTLEETGVFDLLRNGDWDFLDKHICSLSSQDKQKIYIKNFSADTFITGVNAVTMDGKLFNIDGNGSRVAPIIYGLKQVLCVIGTNKIVKDVETAIKRTRQIAATLDAKRLKKNTPCAKLGRCVDCHHPERICNDFVLITGQFNRFRIKVIIIDGSYGY